MKKIFLVAMLLCTGGSLVAQQKGDVSVGANVAFQTSGSHIGVGAKARYGLTDRIRLDAGLTYFLPKSSVSSLEFALNAHYLFPLRDSKVTLYPLAGLGYYRTISSGGVSAGNFLFDFGGGASYRLSEGLSVGAEAKYLLLRGFNSPQLSANAMFNL